MKLRAGTVYRQSGFTAVEALLILVIIAILGFAGWFVWHSKQQADKSLTLSAQSDASSAVNIPKTTTDSQTKNWKTYIADNRKFSIRIPDGWRLTARTGASAISAKRQDMVYEAGKLATIEKSTTYFDNPDFNVWCSTYDGNNFQGFTKINEFKTNVGDTVTQYRRAADTPGESLTIYSVGYVSVSYQAALNGSDEQRSIAEAAVRTLGIK